MVNKRYEREMGSGLVKNGEDLELEAVMMMERAARPWPCAPLVWSFLSLHYSVSVIVLSSETSSFYLFNHRFGSPSRAPATTLSHPVSIFSCPIGSMRTRVRGRTSWLAGRKGCVSK